MSDTPASPDPTSAQPDTPAGSMPNAEVKTGKTETTGVSSRPAGEPGWERGVLEKLAFATLEEQRSARRWRIFFRFAFLAALLLIAIGLWRPARHVSDVSGPHTALVDLAGEIAADQPASADNIVESLRNAFEDKESKAVVLRINSPGGSPVQAGIINDEIWRLKALHNKPLYVVVDDICASGGYYVAAAADQIFVDKASLVGSIGVLMDGFGFTGLMDKLGIERRLYTAGRNKGFLDPFSPQSKEQQAYAKQMLDEVHRQFIDVVKRGRGARLKADDPDVFSGLVFNGERSIALGLADGHGTVDSVARDIVKAEKVIDYTTKENVLDRLSRRFGAAAGESIASALRGMGLR
jgi:protease-4